MGKKSRKKRERRMEVASRSHAAPETSYFSKKIVIALLICILICNVLLIGRNVFDPFIRFNEDNNAVYGLAAIHWLKFGFLKLKGGIVDQWLDNVSGKINYYTHHPDAFILPTLFIYKFFGISEFTTRLSPIIFSILLIIIFFLLVYEVYKNYFLALASSFILATLPATTFYGKMLDPEIFVLFFAVLSLYLFFKIKNNKKQFFLYFFFPVIFLGNFIGWHFYFIPIIIWFLILFNKNYPKRKLFLISIPLIEFLSFSLIIYHFYILGGSEAISGLKRALISRTSGIPLNIWLNRMYFLLKLNFTLPIVILGLGGLFYFILKFLKNRRIISLGLILFLFPTLVTLIFRQWVTHPYGPFYYLAFFSLAGGQIIYLFYTQLIKVLKNKIFPLTLIIFILILQFYSGFAALKFFDKNLIFDKESVKFLKEIKNDLNSKSICLGGNQTGLGYRHIFSFYLKTKPLSLEEKPPLAIIFHPQMGEFYKKEAQKFLEKGYQPIKCQGAICLLKSQDRIPE